MRTHRRSLHYFNRVASAGSVRAAAQELHIAPSALSRSVQQLEEEIGAPLFERTSRGLHLTVVGETVLAYLQRWGKEADQLSDAVRSLSGLRLQTIRIATVEVATYELIPSAIATLRRKAPGLRADLKVGDTALVLDSVASGEADLGLTINMPTAVPVRSLWTVGNPVGLVVKHGHRLGTRKSIRLAECLSDPLILPEEPLAARAAIRSTLETAGRHRIAATSNRIIAIKSLLRAGLGVSFLTRMDVAAEQNAGQLSFVRLEDRTILHPYVSLIAPRNVKRSPIVDLMIETLREAMPGEKFRS